MALSAAAQVPEPQVVFAHTLEGLFLQALGDRLPQEARAQLAREGLDLSRKLAPAYPQEDFSRWVALAARAVSPDLSPEAALAHAGEELVRGYERTLMGKAVLALVRLVGPRRALERMTRTLRSGNNYLDTRLSDWREGGCTLWVNETGGIPAFFVGLFERLLLTAGAREARVEVVPQPAGTAGALFRIHWQD
jgi:uncharacterized protein (TIGR02265 family)